MEKLDDILVPNSVMMLSSQNDVMKLESNKKVVTIKYKSGFSINSIEELLPVVSGSNTCVLNSDILDFFNLEMNLDELDIETISTIHNRVMKGVLPYLATIAQEEDSHVLIQSTFRERKSLTINAGIIDDVQILILDLHLKKEEKENS